MLRSNSKPEKPLKATNDKDKKLKNRDSSCHDFFVKYSYRK